MRVAILGSPFNPPHWGHLSIAQQVLDFCPVDKVWLMPTYIYNPTLGKSLVSYHHRFQMANMLERPGIMVSDFEKTIIGPSFTFNVLTQLQKKFTRIKFSFIIGSDWVENFFKWYRWKEVLKMCKFYVFPRQNNTAYSLKKGMEWVVSPLLKTSAISSSSIRQKIRQKEKIVSLVPSDISAYIEKNNLYRS